MISFMVVVVEIPFSQEKARTHFLSYLITLAMGNWQDKITMVAWQMFFSGLNVKPVAFSRLRML